MQPLGPQRLGLVRLQVTAMFGIRGVRHEPGTPSRWAGSRFPVVIAGSKRDEDPIQHHRGNGEKRGQCDQTKAV